MACASSEIETTQIFQENDLDDLVSPQSNVKLVKVVPLPHARSEVWSYFGFIADDDGEIHDKKKTICKICTTTLCYSGNTTNLFTHLKAMHPDVNPQKLAPTNKTPRTGKKSNKRKFLEDSDNNLIPIEIDSSPHYIIRNVQFSSASNNMTNATTTDNSTTTDCEQQQNDHSISIVHSINNDINNAQINSTKQNSTSFDLIDNSSLVCSSQMSNQMNNQMGNQISSQMNNQLNNQLNNQNNHVNLSTNNLSNQTESIQPEEITNCILNLIVRDCRPIELVTGKHFKELIKLLAPNYNLPDLDKLEQLVKKKYQDVRRDLILKSIDDD